MTALGSDQRKTFLQIETHLVAENRQRAGAGAIVFRRALIQHFSINARYCFIFVHLFVAADDDGTPKSS